MSFEWQTKEQAAATLEVDAATLQAWIDQGRAPSRNNQGRVEVLIEFPDEDADTDAAPHRASTKPDAEVTPRSGDAEASGSHPQVVHALEVVSRRELQLAGGIAAAWQRLAEQSDHELVRARRLSTTAWCIVAAVVTLGAAGLWWATVTTKDAQAEAHLAAQRVTELTGDLTEQRQALSQTTQRVDALTDELTRAKTELAAATERSAALAGAADASRRQHEQIIAALKESIDQQRQRVADLQTSLADQRKQSGDTRAELKQKERALAEAVARAAELQKQLAELQPPTSDPLPSSEASADAP